MAVRNPISIVATQNQPKGWVFHFKDHNRIPINLNGFTFQGGFMTQRGKPILGYFNFNTSESDLTNGKVVVELLSGWTTAANVNISKPERLMEFQIRVTDPSNAMIDVYGFLTILRSSL